MLKPKNSPTRKDCCSWKQVQRRATTFKRPLLKRRETSIPNSPTRKHQQAMVMVRVVALAVEEQVGGASTIMRHWEGQGCERGQEEGQPQGRSVWIHRPSRSAE